MKACAKFQRLRKYSSLTYFGILNETFFRSAFVIPNFSLLPANLLRKEKGLTLHDTSSPGIELKHGCTTYNIGEGGGTKSGRRKLQLQAAEQAGWDSVQFKTGEKLKL